jgi:para-nitrobenzyl esterase
MKIKWIAGGVVSLVILSGIGLLRAASERVIHTDAGDVSGVTDANGVTSYKGIPFGAPPVGNLRWQAPQPVAHWQGVRKADHFGNACYQNENHSRLPWTEPYMEQGPVGEDCLYLNVWTAAKSPRERRPVMVYMYGGGFNEGAGSVAIYDGTNLAKRGAVIVNMNYRVGPLGFLVYPELTKESEHNSSGNYGLLDQIAALQWVHKNIAAFGGDPGRVTIFGQSAGALSVYDLMQSPLAKGLFVRAIAESGPGLIGGAGRGGNQPSLADREQAGVKWAEAKGAHSLAELRALTPADTLASTGRGGPPAPNSPVADGWVLPTPGSAPPPNEASILLGMVADDIGVSGNGSQKPTVATYTDAAKKKYGDKADEFLKLYPVSNDDEVPLMQKTAARDQARVSIDLWSARQLQVSPKVYTYYFDRVLPWPEHPEFGAFHTSDVTYVFNNLDISGHPVEAVDHQVADAVSSYWINFATNGDPNAKGLTEWPAYSSNTHSTMELGEKMGSMPEASTPERIAFQVAYLTQPPAAGPGR